PYRPTAAQPARPPCVAPCPAASSTSTTRRERAPLVSGSRPVATQSTKWAAASPSGSAAAGTARRRAKKWLTGRMGAGGPREVVRRRVPPHVRVAPDAAHAEPLEGEMVELAERSLVDQALHLDDQRIVEERLVDEEDASGGLCRVDELASLGGRERQRLLHPH